MLKCACGLPARLVGDVYRDGMTRPERLLLCSVSCGSVCQHGTAVGVVLDANDFRAVEAARPCWCDMRKHGCIVPVCPEHGEHR